jgi:Ca2+-binding RTX toxin-like protein
VLFGGPGNDLLVGGTGNNLFIAESGNETLTGGGNSDSYVFISTPCTTRTDVITNSNPNVDAIGLFGYGSEPGADQAALASATQSGGNSVVSLTDGTTIIFTGATTLNSYNFF